MINTPDSIKGGYRQIPAIPPLTDGQVRAAALQLATICRNSGGTPEDLRAMLQQTGLLARLVSLG